MALLHSNPTIVADGLVMHLDVASNASYPKTGTVWSNMGKGINIGPELFPEVSFFNTTTWFSTVLVRGNLSFYASGGGQGLSTNQQILTIGKSYIITLNIANIGGTVEIRNGFASGGALLTISSSSPGVYTAEFTATATQIYIRSAGTLDVTFNSISIKESAGNFVGGVTYNSSNLGFLTFNGSTGYGSFSDNSLLNFNSAQSFTLSTWVKPASLSSAWRGIVTKGRDTGSWYGIWLDPSNRWVFGGGGDNIFGPTATTNWQNVVISKNGTNKYIYINGVLGGTQAASFAVNSGTLFFGRGGASSGEFFDGNISVISTYNKALSSSEILQNYNAVKGRYGL
jgi:hypothetical protein